MPGRRYTQAEFDVICEAWVRAKNSDKHGRVHWTKICDTYNISVKTIANELKRRGLYVGPGPQAHKRRKTKQNKPPRLTLKEREAIQWCPECGHIHVFLPCEWCTGLQEYGGHKARRKSRTPKRRRKHYWQDREKRDDYAEEAYLYARRRTLETGLDNRRGRLPKSIRNEGRPTGPAFGECSVPSELERERLPIERVDGLSEGD